MIRGATRRTLPGLVLAVAYMQMTSQHSAARASDLNAKLLVTNDGPTILGATTTFTATLILFNQTTGRSPSTRLTKSTNEYTYFWRQTLCGEVKEVAHKNQNQTSVFSQTYTCPEDVGPHSVDVRVCRNSFLDLCFQLIASNTSDVKITEHINAKLSISQGVSCNYTYGMDTCDVVATNKSVEMGVNIHDPSNFFKDATLLYHWTFGDGVSDTVINQPWISHNYTKPGRYGITVNITAIFPDYDHSLMKRLPRTGSLSHHLKTMDAIKNLTINGTDDPDVGVTASYNISCHASLPVDLCWYVTPTTTHTSTGPPSSNKIKCNQTVLVNRTWLIVDHKFSKTGGYSIGVYASNAVSNSDTNKAVHATEGSKPQQLAGLVIGILFGIAGCFLCIAVFVSYIKKQKLRNVEVANFDFQGRPCRGRPTMDTNLWRFLFHGSNNNELIPLAQDFNQNKSV